MKVIETRYAGYKFRSRTEARWAVFFDAIGLPYRYEEEGYDLNGTWYLPDFILPDWNAFVEVKGAKPNYEEIMKARWLRDSSKKHVLIVSGSPWPGDYVVYPFLGTGSMDFDLLDDGAVFLQCRRCPRIYLSRVHDGTVEAALNLGHPRAAANCTGCEDRWPMLTSELEVAFEKARSERFSA